MRTSSSNFHFQPVYGAYLKNTSPNHEVVLPPPLHYLSPPPTPLPTCRYRGLSMERQLPCLGPHPHDRQSALIVFLYHHANRPPSYLLRQTNPPPTGPSSIHWPYWACPKLPDSRTHNSPKLQPGQKQGIDDNSCGWRGGYKGERERSFLKGWRKAR